MEERLIESVKDKPYLWNIKDKMYKNVYLKEKAWGAIGKELGISSEKAKKKFKSLRDYYRSQKQSRKQTSGSQAPDDVCTWKYFNNLKFLDDSLEPRKTHTVIEDDSTPSFTDIPENLSDINFEYSIEEDSSTIDGSMSFPSTSSRGKERTKGKNVKSGQEEAIERAQEQFKEAVDTFKEAMMPRTHIRAFFDSIALQVEQANLRTGNWLALQEEIFNSTLMKIRKDREEKSFSK